jgi:hypothetical protein
MAFTAFAPSLGDFQEVPPLEADFYNVDQDVYRGVALVNLVDDFALDEKSACDELRFGDCATAPQCPEADEMGCSVFRTALSATAVGNELLGLFAMMAEAKVEKLNQAKCTVKVRVSHGELSCVLKARIYESVNERVVEFQRRSGDALVFQDVFCRAASALGDDVSSAMQVSCIAPSLPDVFPAELAMPILFMPMLLPCSAQVAARQSPMEAACPLPATC